MNNERRRKIRDLWPFAINKINTFIENRLNHNEIEPSLWS